MLAAAPIQLGMQSKSRNVSNRHVRPPSAVFLSVSVVSVSVSLCVCVWSNVMNCFWFDWDRSSLHCTDLLEPSSHGWRGAGASSLELLVRGEERRLPSSSGMMSRGEEQMH